MRESGIDPNRLSVFQLGRTPHLSAVPTYLWQLIFGLTLWVLSLLINQFLLQPSLFFLAGMGLVTGLIILIAACEILISATERLAARFHWTHYTAGTLALANHHG